MRHPSSTQAILQSGETPRHLAIIMDGNGRWARKRRLPRFAGHKRGVESVRNIVEACIGRGIEYLTLFAFSSENWRRPADEVKLLMQLFRLALVNEIERLDRSGVRLKVVGDLGAFGEPIRKLVAEAEARTAHNSRLTLTIAANYGGRWDILQACRGLLAADPRALEGETLDEAALAGHLAMSYAPEPDLFVRTGGEQRVSNFLLWQLAYTELYFTDTLWPDFDAVALDLAITNYRARERRFGRTSDQLSEAEVQQKHAAVAAGRVARTG